MFPAAMNTRTRTALTATLLNTAFTLTKGLVYCMTGSLAVLAETWHSLSDIVSSVCLLVTFAKQDQTDQQAQRPPPDTIPTHETTDTPYTGPSNEVVLSLAIGIVLLVVSASIYYKGSLTLPDKLTHTVPAGLFFILFSLCSFALSRYEERVGKSEQSIGLLADASHSKADMFASLLTGFSLILHAVGLQLDRLTAYLIATLILSSAIETILNSVLTIIRHENKLIQHHKTQDMLIALFKPSHWKCALEKMENHPKFGWPMKRILKTTLLWGLFLLVLMLLTPFLTSSIYSLRPYQQAIIERLGIPLQQEQPIGPGLHIKWPWPIDRVIVFDTRRIHTIHIGTSSDTPDTPLLWTRQHGTEEPYLSGENSFFYPYANINYTITNLYSYTFYQCDPTILIQETAKQIMTRTFLSQTFYDIAAKKRAQVEQRITSTLQDALNTYKVGVQISDVFLRDIHPPIPISPAFEQVIAAFQKKEQVINEALSYRNEAIPGARADSDCLIQEANTYTCTTLSEAVGTAQRQQMQLQAFSKYPHILRRNLYLQTVLKALAYKKMILIDPATGQHKLWNSPPPYGLPADESTQYYPANLPESSYFPTESDEFYEEDES